MNIKNLLIVIILCVGIYFTNLIYWSEISWEINWWWNLNSWNWIQWWVIPSTSSLEKPNNIVVTPLSTSSLQISFSATNWASSYKIYRSTNSDFTDWVTTIYNWALSSYIDNWLSTNTIYYYKVSAIYIVSGQTLESTLQSVAISWKTNSTTISLSWDSNTQLNILTWNWFQIWTWSITNIGSWIVVWDNSILMNSWTFNIWIILVSRNSVEIDSWSTIFTWVAEASFSSWINITLTWWAQFSWTINPPTFQAISEADELSWAYQIISIIKVWNDENSIYFDSWVTLRIPTPWTNAWDIVSVYYSTNWTSWNLLSNQTVILINWLPYIEFTTTHFSYFSVWEVLPMCSSSDYDVWEWSTCSSSSQSRTVTKKSTSSCNADSPVKPSTTQSCSSWSSSSSSWWGWGWWWGWWWTLYTTKTTNSTWENLSWSSTNSWNNLNNESIDLESENLEDTEKNDQNYNENTQNSINDENIMDNTQNSLTNINSQSREEKLLTINTTSSKYIIGWLYNVELKIPNFKSENTIKTIKSINKLILKYIYEKRIWWYELNELISNYNNFILSIYELKENNSIDWKKYAYYYLNNLLDIYWNYKEIIPSKTLKDNEFEFALSFLNRYWLSKFNNIDEFKPFDFTTREQASKMFSIFAKDILNLKENINSNCEFKDLNWIDSTLKNYILSACNLWIMKWWNWEFKPFESLKKSQAIVILIRTIYWNLDENKEIWYENYITKAIEKWLIKETDKEWNKIDIKKLDESNITRYELWLMLYRAFNKINNL